MEGVGRRVRFDHEICRLFGHVTEFLWTSAAALGDWIHSLVREILMECCLFHTVGIAERFSNRIA